ncbi:ornithine cyclodeaminase [Thalassotalea loyana]|uniref:Ornithine cyclodeaminase n=1 Tax=Thalassotalea loyana TaxID=280483 RepID=A0ABQ6HA11_9GAMM|nr:ornithine cyclodeaminase family protein [Thalassotalea loyana]GLX84809.1 ornithine cyclodeaminase [Thalassotalea loyana]
MSNIISAQQVRSQLGYVELINKLEHAFASDIETPLRQHFDIPNPVSERETTLLMMPSWQVGEDIGVKLVTVVPESYKFDLPSIKGIYVLINAVTGEVKATIDAPSLTAKRTAAASALASRFLSRENSRSLLMIGTGTLSSELIEAHCSVRPIEQIFVWGRDIQKAKQVLKKISHLPVQATVVEDISEAIAFVDIVSCATMSIEPLISGTWLKPGQHLDMVGAYRPDMREADDECLLRSRIVVDNLQGALKETGDLAIPLSKQIIKPEDIEADLFALARKDTHFLRQPTDITFFKSVGHALEDLAAAQLLVSKLEGNS